MHYPVSGMARIPAASLALQRSVCGGLAAPPVLTRSRQGIDWIVVFVEAAQGFRIVGFNAGLIVFRPVGDALLAVVLLQLMDPALADERHVANDARRGKARQITHDVMLELDGFMDR